MCYLQLEIHNRTRNQLHSFLFSTKLGNANAGEHGPVKISSKKPWVTTILVVPITIGGSLLVIVLVIVLKRKHRSRKEPQHNEHLADPVQDTQTAQPQHTWV